MWGEGSDVVVTSSQLIKVKEAPREASLQTLVIFQKLKIAFVEHNGIEAEFSMKQTNVFKSCLTRQVNEAVRIEMSTADCIMNSKAEFHQAPLVRVVPVTGLLEEQEAGADPRQPVGGGRGRAGRRAAGRN